MKLRLIQRRTVWWPTLSGWILIVLLLIGPCVFWWFEGESLLSATRRQAAEILVVEAWIGNKGIQAAAAEFANPAYNYRYIVVTGGSTSSRWEEHHWRYTEMAKEELLRSGIPPNHIIVAPSKDTESQRTFAASTAVRHMLQEKELHPSAINVFTLGAHAMRSRLIFAKLHEPAIKVGVVSWIPEDYKDTPWWKSSERAKDILTESAGFMAEALLNSGRSWNNQAATVDARP